MTKKQNWLQRLAQDPNQSWAIFKRGLGLFGLGAVLILAGAKFLPLIQIPGLALLVIGGLYAIRGYLGILVDRMTNSFKPPTSSSDEDK